MAGLTIFNDLSARDIQAREHSNKVILLGKSFDGSCPLGPYLVTMDEVGPPDDLKLVLKLNGEERQNSSTANMVYKIADMVAWWSNITIEPGDVLLTNYAGTTGQHLNHLVTYTPIFSTDGGQILAFSVILVHCVDIGGWYVGSIGSKTTNVFQEGTQIRTVKLVQRGKPVPEIHRIIEHNTRFPTMVMGDLAAQIAGCNKAAELFRALLEKHVRFEERVLFPEAEARLSEVELASVRDAVLTGAAGFR